MRREKVAKKKATKEKMKEREAIRLIQIFFSFTLTEIYYNSNGCSYLQVILNGCVSNAHSVHQIWDVCGPGWATGEESLKPEILYLLSMWINQVLKGRKGSTNYHSYKIEIRGVHVFSLICFKLLLSSLLRNRKQWCYWMAEYLLV